MPETLVPLTKAPRYTEYEAIKVLANAGHNVVGKAIMFDPSRGGLKCLSALEFLETKGYVKTAKTSSKQ